MYNPLQLDPVSFLEHGSESWIERTDTIDFPFPPIVSLESLRRWFATGNNASDRGDEPLGGRILLVVRFGAGALDFGGVGHDAIVLLSPEKLFSVRSNAL